MGLKDSYNTGDDAQLGAYNSRDIFQTFTTGSAYSLTSIKIKVWKQNFPQTCRVSLYAVDGSHQPTGSELAGHDEQCNTFVTDTSAPGAFYEWVMDSAYGVSAATEYAIVLKGGGFSATQLLNWRNDTDGGTGYCGFGDVDTHSWTDYGARLFLFETYTSATAHSVDGNTSGTGGSSATLNGTFGMTGSAAGVGGETAALGKNIGFTGSAAGLGGSSAVLDQPVWDAILTERSPDLSPWFNVVELTGLEVGVVTFSSADTVTTGTAIKCDTSGGAFNLGLPALEGKGRVLMVSCDGANTLTLDPNGAETINGDTDFDLYDDESLILVDIGTEWRAF
jgi:hypothetical protein